MAYVRRKGNQLAIVHGERDTETRKVEQRVLISLYSNAGALESIGCGSGGEQGALRFQRLLNNEYPGIPFNWDKIQREISNNLTTYLICTSTVQHARWGSSGKTS